MAQENYAAKIAIQEQYIDALFNSDYFKKMLDKYISENLYVRKDFDMYTGTYDEPKIYFKKHLIQVKSRNYGI